MKFNLNKTLFLFLKDPNFKNLHHYKEYFLGYMVFHINLLNQACLT